MKLLLRRSHRPGLLDAKVIYILDVRAQLSEEELGSVFEYGLASTRLYQRMEVAERGRGLLGIAFRFTFGAANLSLSVRDLIHGKRIECADIVEMLAVEDQIKAAAHTFNQVLAAAVHFDGEEALDL